MNKCIITITLLTLISCSPGSTQTVAPGNPPSHTERWNSYSTEYYSGEVLKTEKDGYVCFVLLGYNKGGISCLPSKGGK